MVALCTFWCMMYFTSQVGFVGRNFACIMNAIAGVVVRHMCFESQSNAATPFAISDARRKYRAAASLVTVSSVFTRGRHGRNIGV